MPGDEKRYPGEIRAAQLVQPPVVGGPEPDWTALPGSLLARDRRSKQSCNSRSSRRRINGPAAAHLLLSPARAYRYSVGEHPSYLRALAATLHARASLTTRHRRPPDARARAPPPFVLAYILTKFDHDSAAVKTSTRETFFPGWDTTEFPPLDCTCSHAGEKLEEYYYLHFGSFSFHDNAIFWQVTY